MEFEKGGGSRRKRGSRRNQARCWGKAEKTGNQIKQVKKENRLRGAIPSCRNEKGQRALVPRCSEGHFQRERKVEPGFRKGMTREKNGFTNG